MANILTGTKIKDTYPGLIKTNDNGPLGATASALTDGLGNELPLQLSTTNVNFTGNVDFTGATVSGLVVPAGPQGFQGFQGPAGIDGLDGAQGFQGPIGDTGLTGPQGAQGPAGIDGLDGAQGPQGPQGPVGETGVQGPQGPIGTQGVQGPSGGDIPSVGPDDIEELWLGSQAQYDALSPTYSVTTIYFIK